VGAPHNDHAWLKYGVQLPQPNLGENMDTGKKSRGCSVILIVFFVVLFLLVAAGLVKYFILYY